MILLLPLRAHATGGRLKNVAINHRFFLFCCTRAPPFFFQDEIVSQIRTSSISKLVPGGVLCSVFLYGIVIRRSWVGNWLTFLQVVKRTKTILRTHNS